MKFLQPAPLLNFIVSGMNMKHHFEKLLAFMNEPRPVSHTGGATDALFRPSGG